MATAEERDPREAEPGSEYFPAVETHLVRSKHVAQTFKIQVMQPARRRDEAVRYPVIYATDGNLTFDMLKGISYLLQFNPRDAPRFMLVGIGYPGDSPLAGAMLRGRDLLCPRNPKVHRQPPAIEGILLPEAGTRDLYGAEDFQQFVGKELVPFIEGRYPTNGERTYFGHSAGGGFGLFTLFTQPQLFRNYIVSSPGMTYHGKSSGGIDYDRYDFMFEEARRFIAAARPLSGVNVYMSAGSEEEFEPPPAAGYQLTSSVLRMAALLRLAGIPGLRVMTEIFPGGTHMAVCPLAFLNGVQAVFGTGVWRGRSEERTDNP